MWRKLSWHRQGLGGFWGWTWAKIYFTLSCTAACWLRFFFHLRLCVMPSMLLQPAAQHCLPMNCSVKSRHMKGRPTRHGRNSRCRRVRRRSAKESKSRVSDRVLSLPQTLEICQREADVRNINRVVRNGNTRWWRFHRLQPWARSWRPEGVGSRTVEFWKRNSREICFKKWETRKLENHEAMMDENVHLKHLLESLTSSKMQPGPLKYLRYFQYVRCEKHSQIWCRYHSFKVFNAECEV